METKKRKTHPPSSQKILLGVMGERIIASLLRKAGHVVEESLNVFDMEKDLLVDGNRVEVKTQVPFLFEDSFAVLPGQLKKIKGCHRVYFLSVPLQKTEDSLAGCIFELDPSQEFKAHRALRSTGVEVICFPRRQTAMKLIHRIEDEGILSQLQQLSTGYL